MNFTSFSLSAMMLSLLIAWSSGTIGDFIADSGLVALPFWSFLSREGTCLLADWFWIREFRLEFAFLEGSELYFVDSAEALL